MQPVTDCVKMLIKGKKKVFCVHLNVPEAHPKDQVITQRVVMGCRRVYEYAEWCEKSLLR